MGLEEILLMAAIATTGASLAQKPKIPTTPKPIQAPSESKSTMAGEDYAKELSKYGKTANLLTQGWLKPPKLARTKLGTV